MSLFDELGRRNVFRIGIVILVFAVGFGLLAKLSQEIPKPVTQTLPGGPQQSPVKPGTVVTTGNSVAVLPFVAMSNGPDDDYFSDGLTEEIINALAQLPDLLVTARTSAFHFKDANLPIDEIARQLGVDHVVEGSVHRAGDQLRITAQLIRASDGFHLWSQSYDRRTQDTFAVQSDIAEKVASALNISLDDAMREHMQRAGTRNVEAFISFQKGMDLYERAHQEPSQISLLKRANVEFENAVAMSPELVEAYHYHSDLSSHIVISHAAGELDGNITEADLGRAPGELTRDYEQTIRYAKNANQLRNAEFGLALLTGQWQGLGAITDLSLTTEGCETALWAHLVGGPYGKAQLALEGFARMQQCDPLRVRSMVHMTGALLWMGESGTAAKSAEEYLQKSTHPWLVRALALGLALQGQTEKAMQVAKNRFRVETESLFLMAMIAAIAGNEELASDLATNYFALNGPNDHDALVLAAMRGERNQANRLAALIDARPFGHIVLLQAVYGCLCGAPFDLESTPRFSEMLVGSGLAWPPLKPYEFPLKNW